MALYPSLEDMKVGQQMQAQANFAPQAPPQPSAKYPSFPFNGAASAPPAPPSYSTSELERAYPALFDMGLNLSPSEVAMITDNQIQVRPAMPAATPVYPSQSAPSGALVAPLSGGSLGLQRAQVTHGIRELTLCKDGKGKVGFRVQSVSKGVFVILVQKGSPAAIAGLRFGDQILQIDGENVAGFSVDKVHNIIKKGPANGIRLAVRDRPFERTITLHKDAAKTAGFVFKNGRINAVVKDSSAARNGVLIDHQLLEVNGQNVVGLPDKDVQNIIIQGGDIVTITIMPSLIYDHLIKHTATSLVKKLMDHSVPDV